MRLDICEHPLSTSADPSRFSATRAKRSLSDSGRLRIEEIKNRTRRMRHLSGTSFGVPTESGAPSCAIIACAQPGYGV